MACSLNNEFEQKLEVGMRAEDTVYHYLTRQFGYVQDCRYQRHSKASGPRLQGLSGNIIMPDFIVYDNTGAYAIDVKFKGSKYPINGVECFTVDQDKLLDYMAAARIMRLDGVYIIFLYNGGMYRYHSSEVYATHRFENKYGSVAALFAYGEKHRIY